MSYGFGANSNQSQNTGFSGFGTNNNNGTGFGQQQTTGFGGGTANTGGGLFGGGGSSSGFGSGGFGTNQGSSPFGAKPAFGGTTTSAGGLFGNSTSTAGTSTGFSGFGGTSNTTNPTLAFGNNTNTTGGGLFSNAANKPAFGAGTTTGGGLFGGGNNAFGATNNQAASVFGAPQGTALSGNVECQGTGSTPFQPYTEKEGTGSTLTNCFQTISFMAPYRNYSFEELRLADYNQGRRFGNGSGQAGAFGTSTGFGGFGTATGTGFGTNTNNNNSSPFNQNGNSNGAPFGGAQATSTSFGAGTGSGLFGAKPANAGLFGNTSTSTQPSGGLFGNTTSNTGFGAGTSTGFGNGANTGGGLFGGANNQQKPGGFSFGGTTTTGSTGGFGTGATGFGNANTTNGSGLFGGATATSSPFGAQQQPQGSTSNPFGTSFGSTPQNQNPNQNTTNSLFGGFGGNQQSKPAPFGLTQGTNNTTGTNLFGPNTGAQQQQPNSGLFGSSNPNQGGSTLFGAPKPEHTGTTSLFGGTNPNNTSNPGTSLFGGFGPTQNQPTQPSGLFGTNNQQQQKPSLFGMTNPGGTGANLFGNNTPNQPPSSNSLFGSQVNNNQNQQQQPGSGFFGNNGNNNNSNSSSMFGATQQLQNVLQPPPALTASLTSAAPYGSASIFSGLPPPPPTSVGPIATPISIGQKIRKSAILPQYKHNPSAATRLITPQKRGYGFSYSTYGTPSSISSILNTPGGLSSSLLGGSLGRGLGKSLSTSNLRRTFDSDADSILSPGAFSAGSSRYSNSGGLKRLTIDRSLRTDLFGSPPVAALPSPDKIDASKQPGILKKKVSFDASTIGGSNSQDSDMSNGITNGSSGHNEASNATPSAQEQGFLRSSSRTNGRSNGVRANGASAQAEMEQVGGNELAVVHEDGSPEPAPATAPSKYSKRSQADQKPGQYYMRPSLEELRKMPRDQLKQVSGFSVGREGCGNVVFDEPVDLTTVDLDNLYDNIVVITTRSLTVYPDPSKKPLRGTRLNVPATITLENTWPRHKNRRTLTYQTAGPEFDRHVDRLRKVGGTEFVKYDKDAGAWVFKVPHFTTYGLDYDDASDEEDLNTSTISAPPDTPTPKFRTPNRLFTPVPTGSQQHSSVLTGSPSQISSGPDDTFEFKRKKILPGAFDDQALYEEDHEMDDIDNEEESFLDERSVSSPSEEDVDGPSETEDHSGKIEDESIIVQEDEMDIVGSYPAQELPMDDEDDHFLLAESPFNPKSILKASQHQNLITFGTPGKSRLHISEDWAEQLQRTISPRKQDRRALREIQAHVMEDRDMDQNDRPKAATTPGADMQEYATSIDLMKSLFGQEQARRSGRSVKQVATGKGFEWPYPKKPKTYDGNEIEMPDLERQFHESYKPTWGPRSTLLYAMPNSGGPNQSRLSQANSVIIDQGTSLVSAGKDIRFADLFITTPTILETLDYQRAHTRIALDHTVPSAELQPFAFDELAKLVHTKSSHETPVWVLAHILFDEYDDDISASVPAAERSKYEQRIRKDRLTRFWQQIVAESAKRAVTAAPTPEERALAFLSAYNIADACSALVDGKDFRLATLVAQIGGDTIMREDISTQIGHWRRLDMLSEMTEPIRALYELLAGNTCVCEGKKGALEDRASTFVISERFGLDWKRAFGLRLWYAIRAEEPIEVAVQKFIADLNQQERKRPLPWFLKESWGQDQLHDVEDGREDLLWGLLRLYATSRGSSGPIKLADVIMPQNATSDPLDSRLSFQLYHALRMRFLDDCSGVKVSSESSDQLTWDFADQLDAAGEWTWSAFALLHLSNGEQRQRGLQSLLAHHASAIEDSQSPVFKTLVEEYKIPESWIWEAKALHARSVKQDHVKEVEFLIRAKDWEEAHESLCRVVAPRAIIEQDYTTLQELLAGFKGKQFVQDWGLGGQVYADFVQLIQGGDTRGKGDVMRRLLGALPAMVTERPGKLGFEEMVAGQEMSGVLAKAVSEGNEKGIEGARVLRLPLTEDARLKHTVDLSLKYYRAVMAGEMRGSEM